MYYNPAWTKKKGNGRLTRTGVRPDYSSKPIFLLYVLFPVSVPVPVLCCLSLFLFSVGSEERVRVGGDSSRRVGQLVIVIVVSNVVRIVIGKIRA